MKDMVISGVDLSTFNIVRDYKVLSKQIGFAIIRAGYGKNHIDERFFQHTENLKYEIPLGFYWFSYATNCNEAANEASYLIKLMDEINYPKNLPLFFDFEYDSYENYKKVVGSVPTKEKIVAIAEAFIHTIDTAGYRGVIYTNMDYFRKYFSGFNPVWLAYYNPVQLSEHPEAIIIQVSNNAVFSGCEGKLDRNIMYASDIEYNISIRNNGLNSVYEKEGKWKSYYDKWIFLLADSKVVQDCWILTLLGDWYYIDEHGFMVTGLKYVGDNLYYFNHSGKMCRTSPEGYLE